MQFMIIAHFNEKYNLLSVEKQQEGSRAEWAKSREYYSLGLLRHAWVYEKDQGIVSIFETESREQVEALLADYPGAKGGWVSATILAIEPYWGFFPEEAEELNHVIGH